ncbi:MAG TPA: plastocyanin/azurin family copper-binding protein [Gaiellaceae bacterium]|nr:plastocyanin/azurin family copper-binding protein [Gaiellaceae bacterium]
MNAIKSGALTTAAIIAAVVAAQASAQPTGARSSHSIHGAALLARVNVAASEFKFVLSAKTAKRGLVTFKVTNVGKLQHDFSISGRKTRLLSHGQSATLRVTFLRKGHYTYTCTVPGHAAAGMKGVFTIT